MNIRLQTSVSKGETSAIVATRPNALSRARQMLRRLWRDQRGANFVEYAVLVALIALAGMTFVKAFGGKVSKAFENLGGQVEKIGGSQDSPAPADPNPRRDT